MEANAAPSSLRARIAGLRRSETASAAGLALATIVQQATAVIFTVVFTRILGTDGYGALAALMNLTVILIVPGSALQVAAARQGTLGRFGSGGELAATLDRWTRNLLLVLAGVTVVSVVLREPLASLVNVEEEWGAAAVPVAAAVWLLVCVQRGLLQAARAYKPVAVSIIGEGFVRLVLALVLVAASLDVTGAYLGTLLAFAAMALVQARVLRGRLGRAEDHTERHPLAALARNAAIPITGLLLVAALQNVDVIMARHALDSDTAGVYAATTVAAKFIVWLAVGIGLWVLPESTRRAAAGRDPRPILIRALAIVVVIATPALIAFAIFPEALLRLAFGADYESGADVLVILTLAFALLAAVYVTVQFLLGLHRKAFVLVLAVAAAAEPLILLDADTLETFADRVLIVQAAAAAAIVAIGFMTRRDEHAGEEPVL